LAPSPATVGLHRLAWPLWAQLRLTSGWAPVANPAVSPTVADRQDSQSSK